MVRARGVHPRREMTHVVLSKFQERGNRLKFCILYVMQRKIVIIVATGCNILKLKCIEFDFGFGLRPRPRCGSLQRSPRPLSWI